MYVLKPWSALVWLRGSTIGRLSSRFHSLPIERLPFPAVNARLTS